MLREATDLWSGVTLARGADGRDALWAHPDLLPTSDDLEDPDAFLNANSDLDISDLENDKPATGEAETGEDGTSEIYVRLVEKKPTGVAILCAEPKELTIVNIVGTLDLDRLADLGGDFGIPRLEFSGARREPR